MVYVDNLHKDEEVILNFLIMAEMSNLDTYVGVTLVYFIMIEMDNLLGNIID